MPTAMPTPNQTSNDTTNPQSPQNARKSEYEYELDIFGQQPGLHNLYTQISLIYPIPSSFSISSSESASTLKDTSTILTSSSTSAYAPNESPRGVIPTISNRLTRGLEELAKAIPWIAGQVVYEQGTNSGKYKIIPLEGIPRLSIVDLCKHSLDAKGEEREVPLTMDSLRAAEFPFSMLHEDVIAPKKTLSMIGASGGDVSPVFMVQATILPSGSSTNTESGLGMDEGNETCAEEEIGGVILTFASLHNVMDMTGFGWILNVLDRFCRESDGNGIQETLALTESEGVLANFNRREIGRGLVEGFELGMDPAGGVQAGGGAVSLSNESQDA